MGIDDGQLSPDLLQQHIVLAAIVRVVGHGLADHRQQVLDCADVVIDLGSQQARLVDRMLGRRGPIVTPLNPERGGHDDVPVCCREKPCTHQFELMSNLPGF